jgi:hypothetical protein
LSEEVDFVLFFNQKTMNETHESTARQGREEARHDCTFEKKAQAGGSSGNSGFRTVLSCGHVFVDILYYLPRIMVYY